MEKKRSVLIGPILLLITAFLWGTTLIAQKLGSDYVGPFTYNTYRFTISGVLLLAYFFITLSASLSSPAYCNLSPQPALSI